MSSTREEWKVCVIPVPNNDRGPIDLGQSIGVENTKQGISVYDLDAGEGRTAWLIRTSSLGGPRPTVIFVHEATGDRDSFLDEAQALSQYGFNALLVQAPFVRTEWPRVHRGLKAPHEERAMWRACADEWSRWLTYLIEENVADPSRLAVVGRNLGGGIAGFWLTHEPRLRCAIFAGSIPRLSWFWRKSSHSVAVAARESASEGDLQRFETEMRDLDLFETSKIWKASRQLDFLFQFGSDDDWVPQTEVDLLASHFEVTEAQAIQIFPDGHALDSVAARRARQEWISRSLRDIS